MIFILLTTRVFNRFNFKDELLGINPALNLKVVTKQITPSDFGDFLGVDIFMDALDDISLKREISKFCLKNGVNFIHAGISANALQVGVITTLKIYKSGKNGSEVRLCNLSYVVSRCASLQVAFAINLNFIAKAKQNLFFEDLKSSDFLTEF